MKLEPPMYIVHPYSSLKNLGKKCSLYMEKYDNNSLNGINSRLGTEKERMHEAKDKSIENILLKNRPMYLNNNK